MAKGSLPAAIIIGGDINGLGVARSLGGRGFPVTLVTTPGKDPAAATQYARTVVLPSLEGSELIQGLRKLAAGQETKPVLFLTQEKSVSTVAEARDEIASLYRFDMPSADLMTRLMDKSGFQSMAEAGGHPIPRTVHLTSLDQLDAALATLDFPCVLKPAGRDPRYDRRYKKAYKLERPEELLDLARRILPHYPDLIIQEWIEGGDGNIFFCLQYLSDSGQRVASFVGRKLRSWPPRVGGTASCLPAPEAAEELAALTQAFFNSVGFFGMGSMEFKRDARTGRFLMIEPTVGRTDFQEEVATLNGCNIPMLAYAHLAGTAPPREAPATAGPLVWSVGQLERWSAERLPDPDGRPPAGAKVVDALWRWGDTGPGRVAFLSRVAEGIQFRGEHKMASILKSSIDLARKAKRYYELPPDARKELRVDRRGWPEKDVELNVAVREAMSWLCRAQDRSASQDGGVARHYSLVRGWSPSYPETTGYIIPTMIDYGKKTGDSSMLDRARRMTDWLVSLQFAEGGFPGGYVGQKPLVPVTFNTGQILMGLAAAEKEFGGYGDSLRRAADWLTDTQDEDGCWRKFPTPFAEPGEKTYETHVAWGLIEAARVIPEQRYKRAVQANIDWALGHQHENGWFDKCCLEQPDDPLTHTIGYVLRGVLEAYRFLNIPEYLTKAIVTADALLAARRPDGMLPGRLNAQWQAEVPWACLTGAAQIAHCWLMLHQITGRDDYLQAARRMNRLLRRTIATDGPDNLRGGIKGSYPVDGDYGCFEFLNWANKFFIDSNLLEQEIVGNAAPSYEVVGGSALKVGLGI